MKTLYTHPDGLGSIEYDPKSMQLVVINQEQESESTVSIGPQGLRELAAELLKMADQK